jgi:hypothetical protein
LEAMAAAMALGGLLATRHGHFGDSFLLRFV